MSLIPASDDDLADMRLTADAPASMTRASNHRIAGAVFERRFRRRPLAADHADATVNDFIFDRMIDPDWSPLARAFVDKERAKVEARRLLPGLRAPATMLVLSMDDVRSLDHLYDLLAPFAGTDVIAKPTHASGAATFMRDVSSASDLYLLYHVACVDYASIVREMQYWRLPRKIIVESLVPTPTAAPPDDYKFHCVNGEPLLCQVDHDRFGATWNRLFRVPDFAPMHEGDGLTAPASYVPAAPDRLATMISAARTLATPFEFVRIDLYDGADGVYFGELTFTPAASLGIAPSAEGDDRETATHRVYSRTIMHALSNPARRGPAASLVGDAPCPEPHR